MSTGWPECAEESHILNLFSVHSRIVIFASKDAVKLEGFCLYVCVHEKGEWEN